MAQPKKHGLTQGALDQIFVDFCAGCRDPVGARWLIVECLDSMTDDQLLERALSMPPRSIEGVPTSTSRLTILIEKSRMRFCVGGAQLGTPRAGFAAREFGRWASPQSSKGDEPWQ